MSKVESADLILKLYELRREEKMREARNWMIGFFPESAADIAQAMIDTETSAYYRMVTTYWDMAASFVKHGAIDEAMFSDIHGEHILVFSKIEPFLEELRLMLENPGYLSNLETLLIKSPEDREILARRRAWLMRVKQSREQTSQKA